MERALDDLVGSWESDLDDDVTKRKIGSVRMEFYPDLTLDYVIFEEDRTQIIKLTYRVVGDKIVTDQPSHPRVEETRFELCGHSLKLFYASEPIKFNKVSSAG